MAGCQHAGALHGATKELLLLGQVLTLGWAGGKNDFLSPLR